MNMLFPNKEVMNPMNPEEVFTCKDLANGKWIQNWRSVSDYKICRKEKRLQTSKLGKKTNCYEYRSLANKCYFYEEDEFIDLLLDRLENRRKYADFLE